MRKPACKRLVRLLLFAALWLGAASARGGDQRDALAPVGEPWTGRLVLTLGGEDYVCDTVLQPREGGGAELLVLTQMGVLARVRLAADGAVDLAEGRLFFRQRWAGDYLARDLALCLGLARGDGVSYAFNADGSPASATASTWGRARCRVEWRGGTWDGEHFIPQTILIEAKHYRAHLRVTAS